MNNNKKNSLIDKKGYIDFLHKKKLIEKDAKCMYETLEEVYLNKKSYPGTKTNNQIQYLINNIFKEKKIMHLNHFHTMLTNFVSFENAYNLMLYLKNTNNIKDTDVISMMEKFRNKNVVKNTNFLYGTKCKSSDFTYEQLGYSIKKNLNMDSKKIKYIDICCGDGRKTLGLSKYLNIPIKNVSGTDIEMWGPYKKEKKFSFEFKYIEKNKLKYEDNSFDLITCFLSLHHIEKLEDFLDEIHRILKPNGIFLFIEHNPLDYFDKLIIDIQHTFFSYFYDKNYEYIKNPSYSNYLNYMEWDYLMDKHKFNFVLSKTIYQSLRKEIRYDLQFLGIYKKK